MFVVTAEALDLFRSADRIILCRDDLVAEFRAVVAPKAKIVPFRNGWIGDVSKTAIASLDEVGLPSALEMIVAPNACDVAARIGEVIRDSGVARYVPIVEMEVHNEVARHQWEIDLRSRYCAAVETVISDLEAKERELNERIVDLRKAAEAGIRTVNHASGFLGMLDFRTGHAEASFPMPHTPATSGVTDVAHQIASVWGEGQRRGPADHGGSALAQGESPFGVTHMNVESLLTEDPILMHSGISNLNLLPAQAPTWAFDKMRRAEPGAFLAAGLRWTEAKLGGHAKAGGMRSRLAVPSPVKKNAPAAGRSPKGGWGFSLPKSVNVAPNGDIEMTTLSSSPVRYVFRDLSIVGLRGFTATVLLESRGRARAVAMLVPEEEMQPVDDQVEPTAGAVEEVGRVSASELTPNNPTQLTIDATGLPTDRRYSLILNLRGGHLPRKVRARWLSITRHDEAGLGPHVYQSVRFGDLAQRFEFGDGTEREEELRKTHGFSFLTTGPDGCYFQTHPVVGEIVSARAAHLVPAGCTRVWVVAANTHELAQPTEFGVVVGGPPHGRSFSEFYKSYELSNLNTGTTHRLNDGSSFKVVLMHPGEQATVSLQLDEPLCEDSQLVVFVRSTGKSSGYGWCRWYRVAFAAPVIGTTTQTCGPLPPAFPEQAAS